MVTFESFSAQFLNQNLDHWEGTAVVNGEFKYLKMTDSRGTVISGRLPAGNLLILH